MSNFLQTLSPYKHDGVWVFDDPNISLVREPFVFGADEMLDWLTAEIPEAASGFTLIFATKPFPGYQAKLTWQREECEGNWYKLEQTEKEGWLCPAMFHYFDTAPKEIYAKAESKACQGQAR